MGFGNHGCQRWFGIRSSRILLLDRNGIRVGLVLSEERVHTGADANFVCSPGAVLTVPGLEAERRGQCNLPSFIQKLSHPGSIITPSFESEGEAVVPGVANEFLRRRLAQSRPQLKRSSLRSSAMKPTPPASETWFRTVLLGTVEAVVSEQRTFCCRSCRGTGDP